MYLNGPLQTRRNCAGVGTRKPSLASLTPTDEESYGPTKKGYARLRQVSAFADKIETRHTSHTMREPVDAKHSARQARSGRRSSGPVCRIRALRSAGLRSR